MTEKCRKEVWCRAILSWAWKLSNYLFKDSEVLGTCGVVTLPRVRQGKKAACRWTLQPTPASIVLQNGAITEAGAHGEAVRFLSKHALRKQRNKQLYVKRQ